MRPSTILHHFWRFWAFRNSKVFNNEMWVIGGGGLNDVWHSNDGINWVQATPAAAWAGREGHTSVVFNNEMWVMGGWDGGGPLDDVWYSDAVCVPDFCNNICSVGCGPADDPDCTGLGCCGDTLCNGGETTATCPGDCGAIIPVHGPNQCCKLDHNLTDIDPACAKDVVVGPSNPDYCDVDDDGAEDAATVTLQWGLCCATDTVYTVSDYIFWIFLVLSAAIFIFAGYCFLFSGGGPQQIERGRGFLFWGAAALVIVVVSKIIPAIVKTVLS